MLIPIDKWRRMFRIIRLNGGIWKSSYKLWRFDTLKEGMYVGCDANGNKYYMNNSYFIGRSRWVEHHIKYRWDYDGTHITAEWYGWLHYKTDKLPCEDSAKHTLLCSAQAQAWLQTFVENMTATNEAFYPYSTTRPKVNIWDGSSGLMIEHAVIYLGSRLFAAGKAYVALSCGRTLDGIRIEELDCLKLTGKVPCNDDALDEMDVRCAIGIRKVPFCCAKS